MACETNILEIPVDNSLPNSNDVVIFTRADGTSVIKTWGSVLNSLSPADIEYKVGVTPGFPSDGSPTYQNNALINRRVRVYRQYLKQSTIGTSDDYRYTFNQATGTITFFPNQSQDEIIQIEPY